MFILPCSIIRRIESILAAFLWKDCSLSHSGAKIAWASACYPLWRLKGLRLGTK